MENLHLKIETNNNEIVIRKGDALPLKEPKVINLSGIITTPADWVAKRVTTIEQLKTHVVADYTNRTITLTIDEENHYQIVIAGKLEIFPELSKLSINGNSTYDEKELLKKLNFFGRWFTDKSAHKELLSRLQSFKAKVNMTFTNADDFKGTAAIEKLTKIEHEIPLEFVLSIPVFAGGEEKSFKVEICVSVRDGGISFWLESVELHEIISKVTDEIFEKELARLSDYAIVKKW